MKGSQTIGCIVQAPARYATLPASKRESELTEDTPPRSWCRVPQCGLPALLGTEVCGGVSQHNAVPIRSMGSDRPTA